MTIPSGIARLAGAMIIVDEIDACRPMLTLADTVVDVLVAIFAHPTDPALAAVVADEVRAGDSVDAGVG